ncbi:unnamed protein product [Ectocarpus sp. 12 AP-2014]
MKQEWAKLDSGWEGLESKMSEAGMSMVSSIQQNVVRLNVGGLDVNIARSVFRKTGEASSSTWTLGDLFERCVWDKRLPRCEYGRIVLDESPMCIEELLCNGASKRPGHASFPEDEQKYLEHVSSALGLHVEVGVSLSGGSTTLPHDEAERLTATFLGWCPSRPEGLELLYRASRDGWSGHAFHARCDDDSPSTISLFPVKAESNEDGDSVVGGFSSVPWTPPPGPEVHLGSDSPGSFLFMLKVGEEGSDNFQPTKWGVRGGKVGVVNCSRSHGPYFGGSFVNLLRYW